MSSPIVMPSPAAVHVRDRVPGRTFCGRVIVAGMHIHEAGGPDATCPQCLQILKVLAAADSRRRLEAHLRTLTLAKRAYDTWCAHQGIAFEQLDVSDQQDWIGVVEFLRDQLEEEFQQKLSREADDL
jgi:hypothetical protein